MRVSPGAVAVSAQIQRNDVIVRREAWSDEDNKRINEKITSLKTDPRPQGVEKLSGESGYYRVRVGNFRIIYSISDEQILVEIVKVGDRRKFTNSN